jgi:hypothetical protein
VTLPGLKWCQELRLHPRIRTGVGHQAERPRNFSLSFLVAVQMVLRCVVGAWDAQA